jgi:hypothetical protein
MRLIPPSGPAALQSISSVINARAFGAVGDGITDDRAAIQAALDAAKAAGGGVVSLPPGTYLIKRSLFIGSKVTLRGSGIGVTTITKPASIKSLLSANASALATSVTVADSTGFVVGGAIHLYDTSSYEWLSTQGIITNVAGNVITFTNAEALGHTGLDGALQTARAATATTSFPLIRNDLASTRIVVRDLTLNQNQNANDPAPTSGTVMAQTDFTLATIHWVETYYSLVENVEFLNASGDAYSDQAQDGTGVTPSAGIIKTTKNTIRGCRIRNATRHGVHLGTCMNGGWVLGNEMTSCGWYGMFYCAYVTNTVAQGNIIDSCGYGLAGIDERDTGNVLIGNTIKNCTFWGIEGSGGTGAGGFCTIVGNVITGGRGIIWGEPDCTFSGNRVDIGSSGESALRLTTTADRCTISANALSGGGSGSKLLYIDTCDDTRLIGNIFRNGVRGAVVRGASRLVAVANQFSLMTTNIGWDFEVSASTDCVIRDERNTLTTPWQTSSAGSTVRLLYEGLGDNDTNDPASAGDWNAATGKRHNGTQVRWNSGGGEKISVFYNGVGWTTLN